VEDGEVNLGPQRFASNEKDLGRKRFTGACGGRGSGRARASISGVVGGGPVDEV
jgi:hypothetical protein